MHPDSEWLTESALTGLETKLSLLQDASVRLKAMARLSDLRHVCDSNVLNIDAVNGHLDSIATFLSGDSRPEETLTHERELLCRAQRQKHDRSTSQRETA
jgi:hypothetical protein